MTLPQSGAHPNAVDMSGLSQVWREILSNSRDWVNAQNLNRPITLDVTAGGTIALTIDQQYAGSLIRLTGTPSAAFTITMFDGGALLNNSALIFENTTAQTATINTATGATPPVTILAGKTAQVQTYGIEIVVTGIEGIQSGALLKSGGVSPTATMDWLDFQLKRALFIDYGFIVTTPSISAGVLTLDVELGNYFNVSLDQNVTTLNFNNPSASGNSCNIILVAVQDGTGSRVIAWPAAVVWERDTGESPSQSTAANAVDIYQFTTINGGTTWHGFVMTLDSK